MKLILKSFLFCCLFFCLMFLWSACRNTGKYAKPDTVTVEAESLTDKTGGYDLSREDTVGIYPIPQIPAMMVDPDEQKEFLLKHYWDQVDFTDSVWTGHKEDLEQMWVNYLAMFYGVPLERANKAVRATVEKANTGKQAFVFITDLADKYLYDPNSLMQNEELYIPVLEAILASPVLDKAEKIRPAARLKLALKNRVGTAALDFAFTPASGKPSSLYGTQAEHTLLFFNNPGCTACKEVTAVLEQSEIVNRLLAERRLVVLAIYADEEVDEWKAHLRDFPGSWICGYDPKLVIRDKQLYDLKAVPTLYLLDKGKRVLLKDATPEFVVQWLTQGYG